MKPGAVKVYSGSATEEILKNLDSRRILDPRFVKTRQTAADGSASDEIKCRWVIKGFQDPDI